MVASSQDSWDGFPSSSSPLPTIFLPSNHQKIYRRRSDRGNRSSPACMATHPPVLKIHDRDGVVNWRFRRDNVTQPLPDDIHKCPYAHANDATELKYMNNGTSVDAIYTVVTLPSLSTIPGPRQSSHRQAYYVCTLQKKRRSMRAWDGSLVYNARAANALFANPLILQNMTGLRAIHRLVWDEQGQMLWATGMDAAADGTDQAPAFGTIVGYLGV
ncbi:hypothetical protein PENANT_c056G01984 [Penicillium antarcticum]|uniref:Uncharacterized protein n=1 Tax=Penicillium antarcticum TaxID=416450 RepID=A0A1V6PRD3_9EURO|nr:hypothetical protein PENANT_c056G01984 [Penicillium antarcticum]